MPERLLHALLAAAVVLIAGCERKNAPPAYEVREGVVVERHSDTGELAVRVVQQKRDKTEERTIFCIVTKDSEVYINDVLSRLDAVNVGDAIEIVGYPEPTPRFERFVISFAHVTSATSTAAYGTAPAASGPAAAPGAAVRGTETPPAPSNPKEP